MTDTSFDDLDSPPKAPRDWSKSPTPLELLDYRLVLADAKPLWVPDFKQYVWRAAAPGWVGVNPPAGVVPEVLFADMVFLMRFTAFETERGALAALEVVILRRERNLTRRDG